MGKHAPPENPRMPNAGVRIAALAALIVCTLLLGVWGLVVTFSKDVQGGTTKTMSPPPAVLAPTLDDVSAGISKVKRKCYGSAGCRYRYRVRVKVLDTRRLRAGVVYTVHYTVTGGDRPEADSLTLSTRVLSASRISTVSTPPNPRLKVEITAITARR